MMNGNGIEPVIINTDNLPKILICVLTGYERQNWVHPALTQFLADIPYNRNYSTRFIPFHNFIPAAGARNTVARQVLHQEVKPDWVLMIDSDMSPPMDLLDCIKDAPRDAAVITPKFYLWNETERNVVLVWGSESLPEAEIDGRKFYRIENKFYELNKTGTGTIFIKPEVFEKVPPPWFWYTINDDQSMTATEDINFCLKIREHGFKIYGNGAFNVGHHHTVNLSILAARLYDYKPEEVQTPAEVG